MKRTAFMCSSHKSLNNSIHISNFSIRMRFLSYNIKREQIYNTYYFRINSNTDLLYRKVKLLPSCTREIQVGTKMAEWFIFSVKERFVCAKNR